jgi:hypothetical protein
MVIKSKDKKIKILSIIYSNNLWDYYLKVFMIMMLWIKISKDQAKLIKLSKINTDNKFNHIPLI